MEQLYEYMRRLLEATASTFYRYLYHDIEWDDRMLGIVGPRGVGKTTLLLQRIRDAHSLDDTLYFSADSLYFADHSLYDTAEAFCREGGTYLFIDEVHKYPGWSSELKAIYDMMPDLRVCFTGSSILEIEKGDADLSRRAPKYLLEGLSFREYLALFHAIEFEPFTLEQILTHEASIPGVAHPIKWFKEYLRRGYYPFGADPSFDIELSQVITRTLEVDIPQFANMSTATGRKLLKLMTLVGSLAPFTPNMSSIASKIQVSRNNVEEYLGYLEKAGMIAQLRSGAGGLGALGKVQKVYLDNTNILYNLAGATADIGSVRETFFYNQMRVRHDVRSSKTSDFAIGDLTFEIGGRNKGADQLKGVEKGYVVRDDIEYGHGRVTPLWAFGLTY